MRSRAASQQIRSQELYTSLARWCEHNHNGMARLLFLIAPAQQVDVRGRNVTAVVPEGARGGDTISIPVPHGEFDVEGVMCSTLPSLPGMTVRLALKIDHLRNGVDQECGVGKQLYTEETPESQTWR